MHVGGHLREAFGDWVFDGMDGKPQIDEEPVEIAWLLGQLRDCSDIMPSMLCSELEMAQGSTYATAAQRLRAAIKAGEPLASSATADEWNEIDER
jgi:hypothetical protein